VEVVDDRTLRVELGAPCPYFLDLAAFATLYPVRTDVIAAHGEHWTRPEHFIGNGPFDLADWEPRKGITLEKNSHWHGAAWVRLEKIVARPYEDLDTAVQLFRQRKLDWLPGVPTTMVEELKHDPDYYVSPYLGTYFYRFNCTKPPFDDPHVRRAFSLAIDRRAITEHILGAGQQPAPHLCPPGCAGYEPVEGLDYDLDAARREWERSRYGGDDAVDWPTVELLYNTSESHKLVAETVAQQWERAFGVRVSLRNCEWKVYLSRMTELDYDVMRSSWIGDYNDPNTFFDMFTTGGGNNRTGWSDERYDALLAEAAAAADHARRLDLFRQMERILVTEGCPIAPIYIYVNQGMLSENVLGWHENIRDHHPFQYLWMEE